MRKFLIPGLAALTLTAQAALAAEQPTVEKYEITIPKQFNIPATGTAKAQFPDGFPMGVGSGMSFAERLPDGALIFWAVGDRGPNADSPKYAAKDGDKPKDSKIFPAPEFVPKVAKIKVAGGKAEVIEVKEIHDASGKPISGRPLDKGAVGSTGETPLDMDMKVLAFDAEGLDPEGIDVDKKDGSLWLCDEYGPFLINIDPATGNIRKKYAPGQGLPAELAARQPNRGFEGLAVTPGNKVVAAVQSILDNEGDLKASKAPFIRLVELDPATGAVRTLAYPHDVDAYKSSAAAKIGGMQAVSDTKFVLVEQAKGKDGKMRNVLYLVDIAGATDISGKTAPDGKPLESAADLAALAAMGVTPAAKTRLVDLVDLGWTAEKAEGIALVDEKTLAVSSDNDFGLALTVADPATDEDGKKVEDPGKYVLTGEGKMLYKGKETPTKFGIKASGEPGFLWILHFDAPLAAR
ncbi:esterase-like activity of phytase family protein [Desulfovibrio sulfodismutans]|uniref:Esterase-like activity of phytase family protein n=1 Tax=Desulfolutivibrio sulfodismutans TaxID=63561 RepID=A0A7K3NNJ2_9BACT|nr:esterase-like activity of phytase family protein [Desulfolutivibrio sulfodismutans]NDY57687.1 esterase-like activity of phytase family protein [Desulfolutivibrio sulfodismutans]QLA12262.1 esterase-like activity of phytase family protein [Desulfolutivibrio sulfodismutans DSM 3696]